MGLLIFVVCGVVASYFGYTRRIPFLDEYSPRHPWKHLESYDGIALYYKDRKLFGVFKVTEEFPNLKSQKNFPFINTGYFESRSIVELISMVRLNEEGVFSRAVKYALKRSKKRLRKEQISNKLNTKIKTMLKEDL